jgi:hypothetical protein
MMPATMNIVGSRGVESFGIIATPIHAQTIVISDSEGHVDAWALTVVNMLERTPISSPDVTSCSA